MWKQKRTILITGGTSGLGYATAQHLASAHKDRLVVITGRSSRDAAQTINKVTGYGNVLYMPLDLSTEAGAREFAARFIKAKYPPLEVFILNAALQFVDGIHRTADGVEESFAVNHVNQALVFFLLKSQLTDAARVIVIGSKLHDPAHKRMPLDAVWISADETAHPPVPPVPKDKERNARDEGFRRYGLSKAANVIWMLALADQVNAQGKRWTVMALEPGVMPTNLFRSLGPVLHTVFGWLMRSPLAKRLAVDAGPTDLVGAQLAKMASEPAFKGPEANGKYFGKDGIAYKTSDASLKKENQADLWEWTIREVANGAEEQAAFGAL